VPAVVIALPYTSPCVSCVYDQSLVSTASSHTPHSSSRHSFSKGVCADTQLLGGAAVVNNIYVPLHVPFLAPLADKCPPSFDGPSLLNVLC